MGKIKKRQFRKAMIHLINGIMSVITVLSFVWMLRSSNFGLSRYEIDGVIYLITMSLVAVLLNWYNKGTLQTSGAPDVTYDSASIPCGVIGIPTTIGRHLFAFPNRTVGDSHADAFNQRHTRLVIKAHVKAAAGYSDFDADTFYVFDLPVLLANNIYRITNIDITMLGKDNDDKDDDIQAGRIQPNITVDPWNGTTNLSYEF